jgi:hypothetical protein
MRLFECLAIGWANALNTIRAWPVRWCEMIAKRPLKLTLIILGGIAALFWVPEAMRLRQAEVPKIEAKPNGHEGRDVPSINAPSGIFLWQNHFTITEVADHEEKNPGTPHIDTQSVVNTWGDIGTWWTVKVFTDPITALTAILAIYTIMLVRQGQKAFVATYRPHLIVRDIHPRTAFSESKNGGLEFRIVNKGQSQAKIISVEWNVDWVNDKDLKFIRDGSYESGIHNAGVRLAPGQSLDDVASYIFESNSIESAEGAQEKYPAETQIAGIYFRGVIVYEDDFHVQRRTGFCRRYRFKPDMFIKVSNEDYEYED